MRKPTREQLYELERLYDSAKEVDLGGSDRVGEHWELMSYLSTLGFRVFSTEEAYRKAEELLWGG